MIYPIGKNQSVDEQVIDRTPIDINKPIVAFKKRMPSQLIRTIHDNALTPLRQR